MRKNKSWFRVFYIVWDTILERERGVPCSMITARLTCQFMGPEFEVRFHHSERII